MIDYFYSIKITNSESVSELDELNKLKDATYDMSSIIHHEIPVEKYKETRISKESTNLTWLRLFYSCFSGKLTNSPVERFCSFLFFLVDVIVAICVFVFGIYILIISYGDQYYFRFGMFISIVGSAIISFLILAARHRFKSLTKSIAREKKVAADRGITNEEVKKCYTIVKESDWVRFNKMISKKANEEIQKVKQLFDDGVISQEEFEKKKKGILTSDLDQIAH